MTDLERRLQETLRAVGDAYRPGDEAAARARFLRRRRRRTFLWAGSGVAVAGAAVVAALFVGTAPAPESEREQRAATLRPVAAATVTIGEEPVAVVHAEGATWATDRKRGTVVKIDPATDSVAAEIEVSDSPDDLIAAGGAIWAVDSNASVVSRIDPATGSASEPIEIPGDGGHLDAARSDDALWLLETGGALHRLELATGELTRIAMEDDATDIVVTGGHVWIYARGMGEVRRIDPESGEAAGPAALVGTAGDADLTASSDAIWFYGDGDGNLVRIDRESGAITDEVILGGTYASLSAGADALWALVGEGGDRGILYQLDAQSALPVGEPLPVEGRPFDLAVGGGAAWVTNAATGTVTRLDLVPGAP